MFLLEGERRTKGNRVLTLGMLCAKAVGDDTYQVGKAIHCRRCVSCVENFVLLAGSETDWWKAFGCVGNLETIRRGR